MNVSSPKNRAFSLLELIVVILIIGIVAAFVTPAASTILRGSQLTQATQIVTDQITLARQLALTRNRTVEVRLIRYVDPETPSDKGSDGKDGAYRAIQCFEIMESGAAVPMDKPQMLPQSIVMNPEQLSTLISDSTIMRKSKEDVKADESAPKLPRNVDKNYEYAFFRFLADGSTTLSATSGTIWFLTLHNINERPKGLVPPANFFTLQIDPVSGTTKSYRPGI